MAKRSTSSAPRPAPKPEPVKQPPGVVHHGKVDTSNTAAQRGWGGKK